MSDITLIGLGPMGSALGSALLSQGHALTVWNRTASKADAPVEAGALRAETLASAVGASPRILVCVSGYEAAPDRRRHKRRSRSRQPRQAYRSHKKKD
ncbi:MAG: hypothetical protein EOS11_21565 [Mesorhizobium sp.]|uniref:NAD(P)-binding domain-containing protein n=1 Tax=Mesorhizobium sp. TaxID=1871066 RepID=UPI000FE42DB0|nr:MAG: hypothetical protein EOS10_23530 [Mesorhizobium sp.]RWO39678.1 MAG: hypothetical protein EOS11_21565 [Mesorhizobium sp.]TIN79886.1 MAG: hypothetical protein E5Y09_05540 [Mesorhizobium sp.]